MDFSKITPEQITIILNDPKIAGLLMVLSLWALIWKVFAVWRASQNGSKYWFIALLAINSVGILEIVYLFFFSKKKEQPSNQIK